jgi:5-methylthioadenosine/S-adenosylhomocysteine deaminase
VGLGTDGASSNNQLNMFRDMGLAALIGKVRHGDASAVNAQTALDMATRGSARCLGWPELGRIEAGCPADMIALDLASPNLMPVFNHVSHAVYAATGMEVCMTMVAGEVLYLYGEFKTLDVSGLRREAARCEKWVRNASGK